MIRADSIALLPRLIALSFLLACLGNASGHARAQENESENANALESDLSQPGVNAALDLGQLPRSPDWLNLPDDVEPDLVFAESSSLQHPNDSISPALAPDVDSDVIPLPSGDLDSNVATALGTDAMVPNAVRTIPTVIDRPSSFNRVVRYEIPLDDMHIHRAFAQQGIEGRLVDVTSDDAYEGQSVGDRLKRLFSLKSIPRKIKVVRYDVPAEHIELHQEFSHYDGEIIEPGLLRLPEVRFFQPKARVFMDMKRENDGEFDLFGNGALLASLDVVELYFPMPLFSERFAHALGKTDRLTQIGWRFGGTVGLGITTALSNGDSAAGSAPVSTFSTGFRYEFPLGRPSNELITTGDPRLDQRTRVGFETGIQGGISANESLADSTDFGWYFGILVNTPWNHYGG